MTDRLRETTVSLETIQCSIPSFREDAITLVAAAAVEALEEGAVLVAAPEGGEKLERTGISTNSYQAPAHLHNKILGGLRTTFSFANIATLKLSSCLLRNTTTDH